VKAGGSNAARLASDDREGAARRHAPEFPGLTAEDVLESPHVLIGTPEKIAEDVVRRREEYGFSSIVLNTGSRRISNASPRWWRNWPAGELTP